MTIATLDELYTSLMTDLPPVIRIGLATEATSAAIKAKTDLLDTSAITVLAVVNGSTITIQRGDTLSALLVNLGSLAGYVSIDFTVKSSALEPDDDAIIRIRKNADSLNDGLLWLNGVLHTESTDGSITVDNEATGNVTIMLKATVTDDLVPGAYMYDIQLITAAKVTTLIMGTLYVAPDVTRLVA